MRPINRLSALSSPERMVIDLFRRAGNGVEDAHFAGLAMTARSRGLVILPPNTTMFGADESMLLGWLARYQRQWDRHDGVLPADLDAALVACADALDTRCWRLPYIAIRRLGGIEGRPVPQPAAAGTSTKRPIDVRKLREAVLDLVARHQVVPVRDLKQIGMSQQHLTSLCREGLLELAGQGLYRLSDRHVSAIER